MKVTGYKLREALRRWQLRRETASAQFPETLKAFPGEQKPAPVLVASQVVDAEERIASLQTAQTIYNTRVRIDAPGWPSATTLLEAIKLVGALGRVEKMWRSGIAKRDKYQFYRHDDPNRRKADEVVAERTISPDEIAKQTAIIGSRLAALREAIAVGNATAIDIENLDASLFE